MTPQKQDTDYWKSEYKHEIRKLKEAIAEKDKEIERLKEFNICSDCGESLCDCDWHKLNRLNKSIKEKLNKIKSISNKVHSGHKNSAIMRIKEELEKED